MKFTYEQISDTKRTVGAIDIIDSQKFLVLLHKILGKLHIEEKLIFTSEEEEKLVTGLQLESREDLRSIIKLCKVIYQQAAYHLASNSLLKSELSALGFSEEKILKFLEAWSSDRKEVISRLRERSQAPVRLSTVNWSLGLVMAKSTASQVKPIATLDLGLESNCAKNECEKNEKILSLEFSHEELYDFYNQLETIQKQLDTLTA